MFKKTFFSLLLMIGLSATPALAVSQPTVYPNGETSTFTQTGNSSFSYRLQGAVLGGDCPNTGTLNWIAFGVGHGDATNINFHNSDDPTNTVLTAFPSGCSDDMTWSGHILQPASDPTNETSVTGDIKWCHATDPLDTGTCDTIGEVISDGTSVYAITGGWPTYPPLPGVDSTVASHTADLITGLKNQNVKSLGVLIPIGAVLLISVMVVFFVIRKFRMLVHA